MFLQNISLAFVLDSLICKLSIIMLVLFPSTLQALGCYKSVISFGDSLADTGNLVNLLSSGNQVPASGAFPYGETFFGHPTGRYSDRRLIVDFIAQRMGLSYLRPYLEVKNESDERKWREGVNFAVAGCPALDSSFLAEKGIHSPFMTNVSLGNQVEWFKHMLQTFCNTPADCKEYLESSLIVMGEIGGNDYNGAFLQGLSLEEVKSLVPKVIAIIASAINEVIEIGAQTIVIPGNLPIGCSPAYLTYFMSPNNGSYDAKTGCINWLNQFSQHHNHLLQQQLDCLRELHPHVTIIYADYYNAAMEFYISPTNFGFKSSISACCGKGGLYNYNKNFGCSLPQSNLCEDPSSYVSWDGIHLTEAAYKLIADGLLNGKYTTPPLLMAPLIASV